MSYQQKQAKRPILLMHGGAGPPDLEPEFIEKKAKGLTKIVKSVWSKLSDGASAVDTVCLGLELMEKNAYFNAGFGAALQSDGLARLSASLMDGKEQRFSGVAQATHIIHPSKLALELQKKKNRVLGPMGAQLLSREMGIKPEQVATPLRISKWLSSLEKPDEEIYGTIGVVALDSKGNLAAGTSTGGNGAHPGRLSDVSSIAANYASEYAAISSTGIGEFIVDDALAARIETRVRDGMDVIEACDKAKKEAEDREHKYGWIALDKNGNWAIRYTTGRMSAAAMSADMDEALILD